uniref:Uncharacterized protein n=1 Tax=Moniliophthora roreri TaxID=221103 RepID=A0A0W0FAJ3_MONRR
MPAQRTERGGHSQRDAQGHIVLPFSIRAGSTRAHQLNQSRTIYNPKSAASNALQAAIPPSVRRIHRHTEQRTLVKFDAHGNPLVSISLPQPTGQRAQLPAYGSQSASPLAKGAPHVTRSNIVSQAVHGFPTKPSSPAPSFIIPPNTHIVNHTSNMPSFQGERTHVIQRNKPHHSYPPNTKLNTSTVGSTTQSARPALRVGQVDIHANTGSQAPRQPNINSSPAYGSQSASPLATRAPHVTRSNAMSQAVHGFPTNRNSPAPSFIVPHNAHVVNHTSNMPPSQGERTYVTQRNNPHPSYPLNATLNTSTVRSTAQSASSAIRVGQVDICANAGSQALRQPDHSSPVFNANPYLSSTPLNRAQTIRMPSYGSSAVSPVVSGGQATGNANNGTGMPLMRQLNTPIPNTNPRLSHAYPTSSATPLPNNGAATLLPPKQPNSNPYLSYAQPSIVPSTPIVRTANHSAHAASSLPSGSQTVDGTIGTSPTPKPGVPVNPSAHNPNRPNKLPTIHRQHTQHVRLVNIAGKMTKTVPKNIDITSPLAPHPDLTTIDPRLLLFRARDAQEQDPSLSVEKALVTFYRDIPLRDRVLEEDLQHFLKDLDGRDAFGTEWTGYRAGASLTT